MACSSSWSTARSRTRRRQAFERRQALASGIFLARDLVNEPANVLGPVEFAERVRELAAVGVEVEVLDVDALKALKMDALLGVGQGSAKPSRVVVMQWHGAKLAARAVRSASSARA